MLSSSSIILWVQPRLIQMQWKFRRPFININFGAIIFIYLCITLANVSTCIEKCLKQSICNVTTLTKTNRINFFNERDFCIWKKKKRTISCPQKDTVIWFIWGQITSKLFQPASIQNINQEVKKKSLSFRNVTKPNVLQFQAY